MTRRATPLGYVALALVCFFWGTTYLAIRISIETLTPAFAICVRFLLSGSILLLAARVKGLHLPRGRELVTACLCGLVILGIGNAASFYAEIYIPSGLASLIVTTSPFWLVGFEAFTGGERLHGATILGMLVGFGGAALLLLPSAGTALSGTTLLGFGIMQTGIVAWTLTSLYQRRHPGKAHPVVTGAVQQLAAGLAYIPITLVSPGHTALTQRSVLALIYLVVFGSIVAYSAFIFAMDRLPIAIVSIYPYINAVVAMCLGWIFFREPFGPRELAAMLVIFMGVGIVKWNSARPS